MSATTIERPTPALPELEASRPDLDQDGHQQESLHQWVAVDLTHGGHDRDMTLD